MIIIDCLADMHGFYPKLPGGDLLILAGDYTLTDKITEWVEFFQWLKEQSYDKKIVVAGNHDGLFKSGFPKNQKEAHDWKEVVDFLDIEVDFEYLCDSGTEYKGLKIWGTPWTPWFHGVHPKCKAFMKTERHLKKKFNLIPENLDILITHSPMIHILDANYDGYACGSYSLKEEIDRSSPRFHIFGHIHEQVGNQISYNQKDSHTWCVNCSYVDENYKPVNIYIRIEI